MAEDIACWIHLFRTWAIPPTWKDQGKPLMYVISRTDTDTDTDTKKACEQVSAQEQLQVPAQLQVQEQLQLLTQLQIQEQLQLLTQLQTRIVTVANTVTGTGIVTVTNTVTGTRTVTGTGIRKGPGRGRRRDTVHTEAGRDPGTGKGTKVTYSYRKRYTVRPRYSC